MSENVFFNPGQSIASDYDFNKAYVSAQIYKKKTTKPVLLVQERDGQPYFIFDEDQAVAEEKANQTESKKFKVVKKLD